MKKAKAPYFWAFLFMDSLLSLESWNLKAGSDSKAER